MQHRGIGDEEVNYYYFHHLNRALVGKIPQRLLNGGASKHLSNPLVLI